VLEDAGYRVELVPADLCCGRPLYDHGFLDRAERYLDRILDAVGDRVVDGVTVVGLEPSCIAVLRDELVKLEPHDADARRLSASALLLSELLQRDGYSFPRLDRRAMVHGHCHHKGALGMDAEAAALDAMGLDWVELDAGCRGLAGSFGFEAGEKFDVSVAAGERKLLPAVRSADDDTLIIADGFSCASQIEHLQDLGGGPGRRALHLAEVIQLAKRFGPDGPPGPGPVEAAVDRRPGDRAHLRPGTVAAAVAGLAAVGTLAWSRRRR
jgi:Fe-S oxidoreductase